MTLATSTKTVLLDLCDRFAEAGLFWILGGHAGLIIQGVDLEDDLELDLCTSADGAREMERILREHLRDPLRAEKREHLRGLWATFRIGTTRVEVFGDPEIRVGDDEWVGLPEENIHEVDYEGRRVPVFTLESEYKLYAAESWKPERNRRIAEKIAEAIDPDQDR